MSRAPAPARPSSSGAATATPPVGRTPVACPLRDWAGGSAGRVTAGTEPDPAPRRPEAATFVRAPFMPAAFMPAAFVPAAPAPAAGGGEPAAGAFALGGVAARSAATDRGWAPARGGTLADPARPDPARPELARPDPAWPEPSRPDPARDAPSAEGTGRDGALDSRPPDVDVTPSVGRRVRRDLRGTSTSMREPVLGRPSAPVWCEGFGHSRRSAPGRTCVRIAAGCRGRSDTAGNGRRAFPREANRQVACARSVRDCLADVKGVGLRWPGSGSGVRRVRANQSGHAQQPTGLLRLEVEGRYRR
ncbi:hypothetical protein FRACA_1140021 [Frankia canadensis]|uniref:Uncharacterized protein n=1 Tax=Frankia canadensis TaxID=1836972 RepID=A0A2I2KJM6_9ACTN|nr:hypothetical protein FRACA_1140021 [Frankia canadensis]SOU53137.1 hypothetical protein FRACA_1140021 [Frankia canadensis]